MSMKSVRPLAFVVALAALVLPAASAFAQQATAPPLPSASPPAPDEDPTPPSLQRPAPMAPPRVDRSVREPRDSDETVSLNPVGPRAGAPSPDSFLPTLMGPIGLYNLSTAEVGPRNHLRLALHGTWFQSSNFLVAHDKDTRVNGSFSFGYTPIEPLEIFGAFLTSSNRNVRTDPADMPARLDPELIKSFGDLVLGTKAILPVTRGLTAGFELGFRFLSSISDLSVSPSSTSLWFGPLFMLDLNPLANVPVRFHAKVDYYVDNSKNLIDLTSPNPNLSRFTREVAGFAYGIEQNRLRIGLGADWSLEQLVPSLPMSLFGEYHAEIITASANPIFANEVNDTHSRVQQYLTLGLRARVYRSLTLDAGSDIRLSSVGYQFGPPLPPYNLIFGVSFPFDIDAFTRPTVITRDCPPVPAAVAAAAPIEGQVTGTVKSARDGKPVPGAIVAAVNRPLSRVATDPDGRFQSSQLPPGPATLEVSAAGFETTKVPAAIIIGRSSKVDVTLTPKLLTGNVRGKVTDSKGTPLQAALRFSGATDAFSANADASGMFSASLPVGPYRVTAEMPQMPSKEVTVDITEGQDRQLDIVMRAPNPNVALTTEGFTLKQPIKFKAGPPRLDPKAQSELDAVADLMQDHSEIRTLRIDTYWDSSAGKNAKALTDSQAKVIKDYLVKKGVADSRIETNGQGSDKPLVPNIGPVNKAKNHRVELHVVQ
jgi:outer membrane protein OmpA-like peptidoglycan-associated protein